MTRRLAATAIAVTMAMTAGLPATAHAMSKGDYKGEEARIGAQLRAAQQKCEKLAGNAKDICVAKAEGDEQVAKAELDARQKDYDPEARHDVRIAKAEAEYGVAKEKCDDLAGNAKDLCLKKAETALTRARSEAAADRKTSSGQKR